MGVTEKSRLVLEPFEGVRHVPSTEKREDFSHLLRNRPEGASSTLGFTDPISPNISSSREMLVVAAWV